MALEGHYEIRTIVTRSPLQTQAKKVDEGLQLDLVVLIAGEAEMLATPPAEADFQWAPKGIKRICDQCAEH